MVLGFVEGLNQGISTNITVPLANQRFLGGHVFASTTILKSLGSGKMEQWTTQSVLLDPIRRLCLLGFVDSPTFVVPK